ncbi:MAG: hypothetical protein IPJ34_35310 [Myxococcales bacterium]|nr:hypothetical protein [Myxococcales bacterium]
MLAGQCDDLLGADAPEALARGIRGASFEILPDCGHDLTLEQPELTATRLAAFVLPP